MNTTSNPSIKYSFITVTYDPSVNFQIASIVFSFYQQTALHIAVRDGQERTVESLVKGGANVNIEDDNGVSCMKR